MGLRSGIATMLPLVLALLFKGAVSQVAVVYPAKEVQVVYPAPVFTPSSLQPSVESKKAASLTVDPTKSAISSGTSELAQKSASISSSIDSTEVVPPPAPPSTELSIQSSVSTSINKLTSTILTSSKLTSSSSILISTSTASETVVSSIESKLKTFTVSEAEQTATTVSSEPTAFNVAPIYGDEEGLTTKTVFGFGDYVTTIGNTVMLFTPQGGSVSGNKDVSSTLSLAGDKDQPESSFIEVEGNESADLDRINPTSASSVQAGLETSAAVPEIADEEDNIQATALHTEDEAFEDIEEPESDLEEANKSTNTLKNRFRGAERKSAITSLKDRLRKRFEKTKLEEELKEKSLAGRRSYKSKSSELTRVTTDAYFTHEDEANTEAPRPRTFRSRLSRTHSRDRNIRRNDHEQEAEEVSEEDSEGRREFGRSASGFGRRRRPDSRPSFSRNRVKESNYDRPRSQPRIAPPKLSFKNRGSSSKFRNEPSRSGSSTTNSKAEESSESSSSQANSFNPSTKKSKIQFKKFNRFDRPDIRKNLLNKFLKNRPASEQSGEVEDNDEENEAAEATEPAEGDHDTEASALVPSIIDDEEILQSIDNDEIQLERLQTTLLVSTVYPQQPEEETLEIATIRSPYTFDIENNQKSTRFITVTRTFSKSESFEEEISYTTTSSIKPTKSFTSGTISKTPIFDTKSIPAPENILASTDYSPNLEGSGVIETLPPVILPATYTDTPPFKTVTETLSTEEYMVKKSILPVILGSETSQYTLSQTYTVTRFVTALKTIPPMEFYEFSPSSSFADFDTLFEGAGSENREQLLPGELEFSDQDNFGLEGPSPVRVTPPPGFIDDLDLIGAKLDFVDTMEKQHNPGIVNLKNGPHIDSSLQQVQIAPTRAPTPALQLPSVGGLNISPEQLLYLQLLQNPLAALGLGGGIQPQVVTESKPIYRTETVFETNTIKLFQGAKEFSTVLTSAVGVTTVTDYALSTRTISPGLGLGLGGLNTVSQPVVTEAPKPVAPLGGLLQPSFTVISSAVVRPTVKTQTMTQEIKIIFRNTPTLTTITSTSVVSTQFTSFVTKTQRVGPTVNPLAGLLG